VIEANKNQTSKEKASLAKAAKVAKNGPHHFIFKIEVRLLVASFASLREQSPYDGHAIP